MPSTPPHAVVHIRPINFTAFILNRIIDFEIWSIFMITPYIKRPIDVFHSFNHSYRIDIDEWSVQCECHIVVGNIYRARQPRKCSIPAWHGSGMWRCKLTRCPTLKAEGAAIASLPANLMLFDFSRALQPRDIIPSLYPDGEIKSHITRKKTYTA